MTLRLADLSTFCSFPSKTEEYSGVSGHKTVTVHERFRVFFVVVVAMLALCDRIVDTSE